jgi:hypothetical protein
LIWRGGVEAAAEGCDGFDLGDDPVEGGEREFDVGFVEVEAEKEEDDKAGEEQPRTLHTRLDLARGWWRSVLDGDVDRALRQGEEKKEEKNNLPEREKPSEPTAFRHFRA